MNILVFHTHDFYHVVEDCHEMNQIRNEALPDDFPLVFLPVHLQESLDEVCHEDVCIAKAIEYFDKVQEYFVVRIHPAKVEETHLDGLLGVLLFLRNEIVTGVVELRTDLFLNCFLSDQAAGMREGSELFVIRPVHCGDHSRGLRLVERILQNFNHRGRRFAQELFYIVLRVSKNDQT